MRCWVQRPGAVREHATPIACRNFRLGQASLEARNLCRSINFVEVQPVVRLCATAWCRQQPVLRINRGVARDDATNFIRATAPADSILTALEDVATNSLRPATAIQPAINKNPFNQDALE